ncbi:glycosyltransferase family 2 protein [Spirulina sp. 06S082]|uniref:glycosyltransferase family 2 protein n=1 Tax=Spirulina sp. 06S082 TaxID=3110248 RepID=UPI002B21C689|nr:glycosyltransferase family 2 protein [Spirulina sp. 06S082]MEA5469002.1 glycosyltransferase family 2 protein [Spirulina sp. 06S082]
MNKNIYLVVVNYNSTDLVKRLIKSCLSISNVLYQFVIINNSPEDDTIKTLESEKVFILETEKNIGFGNGCNVGLNWIWKRDRGAIVWLINPDTILPKNTLEQVEPFFSQYSHISILGTVIYTPEEKIWFAGGKFIPSRGAIIEENLIDRASEEPYVICDWISGCSLLINFEKFSICPQFDPQYFLYYEDFDFCQRYRQEEHQIAITDRMAIVHYPSSITNRNIKKKLEHSTYSYLLTLNKYAPLSIFLFRFFRVFIYGLILLPIKPQISLGKLMGISRYLRQLR